MYIYCALLALLYSLRVSLSRVISGVFAGGVTAAEASGKTIVIIGLLSCTSSMNMR